MAEVSFTSAHSNIEVVNLDWDLAVDTVCTGAGAAGLAAAVFAVDFGADVFVAAPPRTDTARDPDAPFRAHLSRVHPWLGARIGDLETVDFLAALSSDLASVRRPVGEADLPISVVHEAPVEARNGVAPFYGARLRDWAARCLASPYGFLHTRVVNWPTTALHASDGEIIEVAEIGAMTPDPDDVGGSVQRWLQRQAQLRYVEVEPDCALQRIVFDQGTAIGAVFDTPHGSLAVRARYGVTVVSDGPQVNAAPPQQPATWDGAVRVCLVSRRASRFGRLELLTSSGKAAPPVCRRAGRHLHTNLRETQSETPVWRCGWGRGYPVPGQ